MIKANIVGCNPQLKQKAERQAVIYRLNLLGWTQEEIAKAVDLEQPTVSEKLSDLAELPKLIKTFLGGKYG